MLSNIQLTVRLERAGEVERAALRSLHAAAFGGLEEADLVDRLRADGDVLVSLVGDVDGVVCGHVLFSRMSIDSGGRAVEAVALAPVAVLPEHQRRGVGGELIATGLDLLREAGERIAIVIGHADYYPRFGFSCEMARGLEGPFPRDVFMAMELCPGALEGIQGRVRYAPAFGL